ncbi:hypothetical protein E8E13_010200 [Curvularia kusanoi]|uniref:Uncharacterized protein n=1 Tax=Curvularia kusanoi TaxID=90978 RepID=A0A9P4WEQ7_CURKU|nr:hypothetical protein E8E13_010200 [Curvularia kusanoi]
MPSLTRIPLAAVVCPSAPFLAPRLLRATVPASAAALQSLQPQRTISSTPARCDNASKGKRSGRSYFLEMRKREKQQANRRAKGKPVAEVSPVVIEMALEMQQACEQRSLPRLMELYPKALEARILDRNATHIICQALHAAVRRDAARQAPSQLAELLPFAAQVIADLKTGALPPHPFAYVHLLGIYKDSKRFAEGRALWSWLTEQDDAHVSQAAYGAAIELLSYGNLMSLAELEDLYDEGLKRFPGTYAEYHLSPDAIVPDRTQPVHVVGLPTTLLQGIITARLRSHDWKKAYLGLDTVLRLYPGQTPHRIFELFITERPIPEAYTAYLLACRSGVRVSGALLTTLLNRLRVAMTQSPVLKERFNILRAIANAIYAYQECGGGLATVHVGQFIKAFESLLPEKAVGQDFTPEEAALRDIMATTAQECLAGLMQSGLSKGVQPFVSLVSLAGKLRAPDLMRQTLEDAKTAGITFYPVERRTLLAAAGLIQDRDLVKAVWLLTVGAAEKEGVQLSYNDWITFAKACRRADLNQYLEQQLQEQAHAITSSTERRVRDVVSNAEPGAATPSLVLLTPAELSSEVAKLQGQMENIRAVLMSGQPLDLQKFPFYMHIDPEQPSLGTEQDLRAIYDEKTTDVYQPAAAPSSDAPQPKALTPALSSTGIPLDELRFRNWTNIHEMMSLASAHAASNRATIDQAIKQRKPPKDLPDALSLPEIRPAQNKSELRELIDTLRTPFRRITSTPKPSTPSIAAQLTERKIHKHVAKPFTIRKLESETPDSVFESRTQDPSTSRWVKRRITKTYSESKYDLADVKKKFQSESGMEALEAAAAKEGGKA